LACPEAVFEAVFLSGVPAVDLELLGRWAEEALVAEGSVKIFGDGVALAFAQAILSLVGLIQDHVKGSLGEGCWLISV